MHRAKPSEKPPQPAAAEPSTAPQPRAAVSLAVAAAAAGLVLAGLLAAGSAGLVAQPLANLSVWLLALIAAALAWPAQTPPPRHLAAVALAAGGLVLATLWRPGLMLLPAVAALAAALAALHGGPAARALRSTAVGLAVLACYRFAHLTVPAVWVAADAIGQGLGSLAGWLAGRPLWTGATFGGVDFLVVGLAVVLPWQWSRQRKTAGVVAAVAAVVAAHLVYLFALAWSADLAAMLPPAPPPPAGDLEQTPVWAWSESLRTWLPWNIPLAGAVLQAVVVGLAFRWTRLPATGAETAAIPSDALRRFAPAGLAIAAAMTVLFVPLKVDLTGKTVVAYEKGFVNWRKPAHGEYGQDAAGLYGMLPTLVEALGGKFLFSDGLGEADLAKADVVLIIHPDRTWPAEQLERLRQYLDRGGALLLACETTVIQEGRRSSFNDLLAGTALAVNYDAAASETGNWRESLDWSPHPAAAEAGDHRDRFGILTGSSIDVGWFGRPILVGRFGWSEPGSDMVAAPTRYEAGKRLGDLVLAAETTVGRGRAVVTGDTWFLTNQGSVCSYGLSGRLLAYLAGNSPSPFHPLRQLSAFAALAVAAVMLLRQPDPLRLAAAMAGLALTAAYFDTMNTVYGRVLPDGRAQQPNSVAYIASSHGELHSGVNWADDGVSGLAMNLARNGYLPLLAAELSADRLERAGLLFSIAPARPFTATEIAAVRAMVEGGGHFILCVGAEEASAGKGLLAEFGFDVPESPVPPAELVREPEPLGAVFGNYVNIPGVRADALFYAAWNVVPLESGATANAAGPNGKPIVMTRRVGEGTVTIVADSRFALNKNLERADGGPIFGGHHNALFWRWLFSDFRGTPWTPPAGEGDSTRTGGTKSQPAAARGAP